MYVTSTLTLLITGGAGDHYPWNGNCHQSAAPICTHPRFVYSYTHLVSACFRTGARRLRGAPPKPIPDSLLNSFSPPKAISFKSKPSGHSLARTTRDSHLYRVSRIPVKANHSTDRSFPFPLSSSTHTSFPSSISPLLVSSVRNQPSPSPPFHVPHPRPTRYYYKRLALPLTGSLFRVAHPPPFAVRYWTLAYRPLRRSTATYLITNV